MSKTLDGVRGLRWVAFVDDERSIGNSIIVTLADGYEFKNEPGCGVQGFDTVGAAQKGCARKAVKGEIPKIQQPLPKTVCSAGCFEQQASGERMSAADNLRAARALIEDPKHWTKGVWGFDKSGNNVNLYTINRAVCFCTWGALAHIGIDVVSKTAPEEQYLINAIGTAQIGDFNDTHTHAEVLAAFDKAIELAEAA